MAMKAMKSATKTMATKAMKAIQWKDHPVYRQWMKEDRAVYYQKNKARIAECNRKAKQKEYQRRYAASPHAKAKKKEYRASPHGKAKQKEYNDKYLATPQGKAKRQEWAAKYLHRKAKQREYNAVYRQKNKARLAAMQAMKAKKVKKKEYNAVYYQKNKARLAECNAVYYQKKKARLAAMQKKYMLEYQCTVLAQAVSPKRFREANPPHDYDDVKTQCHACLRIMEILEQDALYLTRRLWVAWKASTFNRGESD